MSTVRKSLWRAAHGLALLMIAAFVLLPIIGVLSSSLTTAGYWQVPPQGLTLHWFRTFLADPQLVGATAYSIVAAVVGAVLGTGIAFLAAFAMRRGQIGRSVRTAVRTGTVVPLLVPTISLGLGIYTFYILARVPINAVTLATAQLIIILPLVLGVCEIGFDKVRPNTERAAANLGASRWQTAWKVVLPVMRPTLIAATVLAFIRSFDDSAIALFVNSPGNITLPVRMLVGMQHEAGPLIAASGSVLLLMAVVLGVVLDRTIGIAHAFGLGGPRKVIQAKEEGQA